MNNTTQMGFAQSVRSSVTPCTLEILYAQMDSPQTAKICAEIAEALEKVKRGEMTREAFETLKRDKKKQLPVLTPHATFADGLRSNKTAQPSGLSMYDIDHIPNPRLYFETKVRNRLSELGIVLAHKTPSTEGLRLIFAVPEGMSLAEAQKWMSEQLDDSQYDGSVKDYARCSFIVPRAYLLYIDEEELCKHREAKVIESSETSENSEHSENSETSETSENIDRNLLIFDRCLEEVGLKLEDIDNVGIYNWHNTLVAILSVGICRLMTEPELKYVLKVKMPNYSKEQDCKRLVSDFYKDYTRMNAPMSQRLRIIYAESVTGKKDKPATTKEMLGEEPPKLPKRLPRLIKLLTSKEPDIYKPAVIMSAFPALGTHLLDVHFPYADNTLHEATFMNCVVAPMSSGKSCINRVCEPIMADIKARDDENRKREDAWKEECRSMGANKQKPKRPDDLTIQIMSSDLTNAALVQKLQDAHGHFLYTHIDEVELFEQLKVNGKSGQIGKIFRLAFDCGYYGQERVGIQSVTGRPQMRWNWNAASTIQRSQQFFRPMIADGTLSRISFATILTKRGMPIPVHGIYDEAFKEALKPSIDRLCAAKGIIDLPEAKRLIQKLDKEAKDTAWLMDDEQYEKQAYRAIVCAWLRAMVLYIAEGKWSKEIENLAMWSMKYDLWCKMHFFGQLLHAQMAGEVVRTRGPKNMLNMLPDTFTEEDIRQVRLRMGKDGNPSQQLAMWIQRGHITRDEHGIHHKTPTYLKRKEAA